VTTILVSGALANKPLSGGEAWVRMSWVRGLRRLGFDVCFVEQIASAACVDEAGRPAPFARSLNRRYFEAVVAQLAPDCDAALICADGDGSAGLALDDLLERARDAELLVNISGHLTLEPLRSAPRRRAYIDIDPGFTQIWHASGALDAQLDGHERFFTVGENIGDARCSIPTGGLDWRPLPPPVTLEDWPMIAASTTDRFTTIATWRSPLGTLSHGGMMYPGKHHEWRRIIELPRRSPHSFEIALDINPGDAADRAALERNGWRLDDPRAVAADPIAFRSYVQGSGAELSVAHGVYVETASGWISDRTVRYLASGRPALVQDTGIGTRHPVGEGLLTFRDLDGAVAAADAIVCDHAAHAAAARALAEERFDSDRVLARFLDEVGVG